MPEAEIKVVSNEAGEATAVIVPIALWKESASERETAISYEVRRYAGGALSPRPNAAVANHWMMLPPAWACEHRNRPTAFEAWST